MIKFAVATEPRSVKGKWPLVVGYGLALWTIVIAVAQMVSFEEFVSALQEYQAVDRTWSITLAVVVLALEVFSVPYLLRLRLSPAARFISAVFVLVLPFVWTVLTLTGLGRGIENAGYFGGFMRFSVNEWVLVFDALWMVVSGICFDVYGGRRAISCSHGKSAFPKCP
jgi:hypothetical protein